MEEWSRMLQTRGMWSNLVAYVIGNPWRKEQENEKAAAFEEIMTENSPKWIKNLNLHISEDQWNLNRRSTKKITLKHLIIKLLKIKVKEKNLQTARKNRYIIFKRSNNKTNVLLLTRNHGTQKTIKLPFIKHWKKQNQTLVLNSKPSENTHQEWRQNEDIFKQTKAERIYNQKILTAGNPKESFSGWKRTISDEGFELHERTKHYRKDKDQGKYERMLTAQTTITTRYITCRRKLYK